MFKFFGFYEKPLYKKMLTENFLGIDFGSCTYFILMNQLLDMQSIIDTL